jgi:hypothetical protein
LLFYELRILRFNDSFLRTIFLGSQMDMAEVNEAEATAAINAQQGIALNHPIIVAVGFISRMWLRKVLGNKLLSNSVFFWYMHSLGIVLAL